jgi:hypothetical protein
MAEAGNYGLTSGVPPGLGITRMYSSPAMNCRAILKRPLPSNEFIRWARLCTIKPLTMNSLLRESCIRNSQLVHSYLSAIIGSTFIARRAGR